MVVLAEVVDAPPARGLRYGLFTAANGPGDLPVPGGLSNGIQFEPVSCGSASLYPVECDETPPEQEFEAGDGYVVAEPFLARSTYKCGSVGTSAAQMEERVRRRLANGEQSVAEAGMALALFESAEAVVANDPGSIRSVIAELEQYLYGIGTANYGNVGVLHAPVRVVTYAAEAGLMIKNGRVWETPMGTVWSIGGGYPDNGRIYISGTASVWRAAEVSVSPAAQVFDRRINEYRLIADREYAVSFDCVAGFTSFAPDLIAS